ncbi:MAG: fumarylacetoacetate hydrolase family protein [Gammaproteobacteria bacterium]|nr:fumarylacetoacetate hydrolase family protein [Gammaproteobacteria bacterium]
MKLISYQQDQKSVGLGLLQGEFILNLHEASNGSLPDDMLTFLQMGEPALEQARLLADQRQAELPLSDVKLLSPVPNPSKVIAIGLNYLDHVQECQLPMPEVATMFCKFPSSIIGSGADIYWSASLTEKVDYEAELAIVIGKTAKQVSEANAFDYIAGYTIANDISARDLQLRPGDQWLRGKCIDSFCPLGPCLTTGDEIDDPNALSIQCRLNGNLMQNSNTGQMIYRIPYLIEYLTQALTLLPGDVIITGTPHGVGAFREPPIWLKHDDLLEVEIEGLGVLVNRCRVTD